jgi:hypothetical protein
MTTKYTKEEKKAYYNSLREQWQAAKIHANNGGKAEIEAIIKTHGFKISVTGYCFIMRQMAAQGLDGIPYLDAKTFQGWQENGFSVKKGEKSTLTGLTWVQIGGDPEREDDSGWKMPKAYHLFHRSQVEERA